MGRRIHMCMDIQGFLDNHKKKPLSWFDGLAKKEDGTPATGAEYLAYLQGELSKGYKVVPIGDCDDFDFQTGCRGHEHKEGQG